MKKSCKLYEINEDAACVKCGHRGAVKLYGEYYPQDVNFEKAEGASKEYFKSRGNAPYMAAVVGFGGTVPYQCTNCGNIGLINGGGLEGYEEAFTTKDGKNQ